MKIKKRKKKNFLGFNNISIICCTLIVLLGATGISYAFWNDDLNIITIISTGSIEPYFKTNDDDFKNEFNMGDLTVSVEDDKITIEGETFLGYDKTLNFYVSNRGSIPVRYNSIINSNGDFFDEINIPNVAIGNDDTLLGSIRINPKEGLYSCTTYLLFDQFNKNGWQKKIAIEVNNVKISSLTTETTPAGIKAIMFEALGNNGLIMNKNNNNVWH